MPELRPGSATFWIQRRAVDANSIPELHPCALPFPLNWRDSNTSKARSLDHRSTPSGQRFYSQKFAQDGLPLDGEEVEPDRR